MLSLLLTERTSIKREFPSTQKQEAVINKLRESVQVGQLCLEKKQLYSENFYFVEKKFLSLSMFSLKYVHLVNKSSMVQLLLYVNQIRYILQKPLVNKVSSRWLPSSTREYKFFIFDTQNLSNTRNMPSFRIQWKNTELNRISALKSSSRILFNFHLISQTAGPHQLQSKIIIIWFRA